MVKHTKNNKYKNAKANASVEANDVSNNFKKYYTKSNIGKSGAIFKRSGNIIEYSIALRNLEKRLNIESLDKYVKLPSDFVPNEVGDNIQEFELLLAPPERNLQFEIDSVINLYKTNYIWKRCNVAKEMISTIEQLNELTGEVMIDGNTRYFTGFNLPKYQKTIMEIETTFRDEVLKNTVRITASFKLEAAADLRDFTLRKRHQVEELTKVKSIFHEFFSNELLELVPQFSKNLFRSSLWKLNRMYLHSGNKETAILFLQNGLNNIIFDPSLTITDLVVELDTFITQLSVLEVQISDRMKVARLGAAIKRGTSNKRYLEMASYNELNTNCQYSDFCDSLISLEANLLTERSEVNQKPKVASVSNSAIKASSIQCSKCGKKNHTADTCYSDKACSFCHKKGHVSAICFKKKEKEAAEAKANSSITVSPVEE
jgi:hypothetical protein